MKKILVIGIKGMAGHVIFNKFKDEYGFAAYGIARNIEPSENTFNLDVNNTDVLGQIITEHKFDVIVNCIGILNKDAEDNPDKAIWFNSYFPHYLEKVTKNTGTKVIHISTDCVFSGNKGNYTEEDFKDGVGFYAQSKALGEIVNDKDLTIRTSIIGPELNENGIGLFHWFMSQPDDSQLKGYSQAFWSGITTIELAKVVKWAIEENVVGLKQIAPHHKINKFDLLQLFNEIFRENKLTIIEDDHYKVDKSLLSIVTKYTYNVPEYREMLIEMKEWIKSKKIYKYEI
ncbi:NAD(P)-dependent oxidoreductase [Cloacibacterium normanense]|uniref:dTDP-4-dehydrorhamnose reductase n=1 Tax=Cloacibacterium normanense TaxID=237258 RepID=A0A2S7I1T1_9FLAO|nr:SDR family oxidoreductase [Cloacibacterium normanense]PPZ90540.1 NAD(P)-dependent oxidoreductase [Cloacibacterium normanense]